MQPELGTVVNALLDGNPVTSADMETAVGSLMDGKCEQAEIGAFLTALRMSGEQAEHLVGAARAMRERVIRITPQATGLVDTCGTGGDGLHSFNISTATAIVAAAAGVPVAKHGNRSVSSSSGSADVLEEFGVVLNLSPEQVASCIDETGIGFCFAPLLHGAMKYAAPVRKQLGFRTVFNLLGPLTNPAGAKHQLLGTPSDAFAELIASALFELGTDRSLVVCGNNETDELCLWGPNAVFEVTREGVEKHVWTADDFGLATCSPDDLKVTNASESAAVIQAVFDGESGAAADIVSANVAAVLWLTDRVDSLQAGVEKSRAVLTSGAAAERCSTLREWTVANASG